MDDDDTYFRLMCYANLRDDAPWCAYMDWLRDHGKDKMADAMPAFRAELIRRLPVALPIAERLPD